MGKEKAREYWNRKVLEHCRQGGKVEEFEKIGQCQKCGGSLVQGHQCPRDLMTDMTEERCSHGKDANIHPPVYWNPFNKVFQCHKCGAIFEDQKAVKRLVKAAEYALDYINAHDEENEEDTVEVIFELKKALSAYKVRTEGK